LFLDDAVFSLWIGQMRRWALRGLKVREKKLS